MDDSLQSKVLMMTFTIAVENEIVCRTLESFETLL